MTDDTDPSDRLRILERRRLFVLQALSGAAVLAATGSCAPCLSIMPAPLKPGGVYVAWVQGDVRPPPAVTGFGG